MKMKSVGITAEYNPFHNGHLHHLRRSMEESGAEVSIAAMSGYFLQRGQASIADKWQRAEAAVKCGVDLGVEIPAVFACSSAGYYASASVEILENLGADFISFGSESGNIEELKAIAREIKDNRGHIEDCIRDAVKKGISYPRARSETICQLLGKEAEKIVESPNNILALEYINAMRTAQPVAVARTGPGYNDRCPDEEMASATAIRYLLSEKKDISAFLPPESAEVFAGVQSPSDDIFFELLRYKILSSEADILEKAPSGGEGLGNKLKKCLRSCSNMEELADSMKSKRYTRTRIDRFLLQVLLGIEKDTEYNSYIRILAFSEKGSTYLKEVKKSGRCALPVITNINREAAAYPEIRNTLEKDILAADLYNIAAERDLYTFSEYLRKPFYNKGKI